jgi:hypothetical protein
MIRPRFRPGRAVARVALSALCLGWLLVATAAISFAADPSPTPGADAGGDTRTPGQGPGLVGSPLFAIGGVLVVGLISVGLAQAYLRATPDRSGRQGLPPDEPRSD